MFLNFRLFFVLSCFSWCGSLPPAKAQMTRPEALTIEHGLSQGMIFNILQTRDGFLWIATKDGLNRYDGYNFRVFDHRPNEPFSLSENTVTALFEDSRGLLWIGTESQGLNVLDRRTGRFFHLYLPIRKNNSGLSYEVQGIKETPDGAIWVSQMSNGVFRILPPEDWQNRLPDQPELEGVVLVQPVVFNPTTGRSENFGSLSVLPGGDILASSHSHLYRVNRTTLSAEMLALPLPPTPLERDPITTSLCTPGGDIWVAGHDYALRMRGGESDIFRFPGITLFTLVRLDEGGQAWLIAEQKMWRLVEGRDPDPAKPDFILDKSVACALQDHTGNVWMGTRGYGLRKFNLQKNLLHAGAENVSVNGLWEDAAGRIYAKTTSQSICRYDPQTRLLDNQTAFPDAPNRQMDLAFGPAGDYWLLCGVKGENAFSQLRHYSADGRPARIFGFQHAVYPNARLWRDGQGLLWISGNGCELIRFNPETGVFKTFSFAGLFPENARTIRTYALTTDGRGDLWLGAQAGLVRGARNGDDIDFQLFTSDPANAASLSFNFIACLLPDPADPSNILWIGTKGGGINRFDFSRGQFTHFTTANGLPNNVVYGILPDASGALWCSTNRGIVRLSAAGVSVYTVSEGLQGGEFNTQAFWKAPSGALLFGGVNGLNRFFPEELDVKTPPPVFIVGLEINRQKVPPDEAGKRFAGPLEYLNRLELAYDQNNLSLEFAALDFTDPAKNQYRYRLDGLEDKWVEAGTGHFAHYSHLPPGRYVFRVAGSNGAGVWNETPVRLTIVVRPPWWRSAAACWVYFLLFAGLAWRAYRFQINRIRWREHLAFEHREARRIQALEQMKSNFFANVTHEFRTPLTLMLEPLRQLHQNPADPLLRDKLALAERNGRRLLDLVNQLLDSAKLESGSMGLDLRQGDLVAVAHSVFLSFLPSAKQKNIHLHWSAPETIPAFLFDAGKVESILNNLIANALKFTPAGGRIRISLGSRGDEKQKTEAFIEVRDTGIGIPAEALDKIFERFYQVENASRPSGEGTGLGLALSKELAKLMGGDITAESEPGQGARFTFRLPVTTGEKPAAEPESPDQRPAPDETVERPLALIIEDHADLRAFIRQSVGRGWQTLEAADGESGIQKALETLPDIVISDLMMPGRDGYAVCEALKNHELTAHIPIIVLTAKAALHDRLKGLRAGADDYLTKPFNAEELRARMDNLRALRRRLRERYEQISNGAAAAGDHPLSAPDQAFVLRFTQTIEQHLADETLGVEDFARKMFVSRVQLHRKLKGLTGRSATEFIRDYRLERARALLKNREGGVGEIAMRVGFGNEKYFSTAFKEKFGMSPSQVR